MNIISLIISLVSGAAGGNLVGALMKNLSLGPMGNSIAGILGGGVGGAILQAMGVAAAGPSGSLDIASLVGSIASGGVGGGLIMAIIGVIKSAMTRTA